MKLRKELSVNEATLIYQDILTLPVSLTRTEALAGIAYQLAMKHSHPVYDVLYVALAVEQRCEFVTADRTLVNKLSEVLPIRHLSTIKP